ncbi:MAG: gliding motility-associated C-terminal domain-containing protein, partial [Ginsengibacter sp.]
NNIATTTYTFTPTVGQCASKTTLAIIVNPVLNATINCGVSTSSAVTFTWVTINGATGYEISYQLNSHPVVDIGAIGNIFSYTVNGLTGGDNVNITVTPTGTGCFKAATIACVATACTPPMASISYTGPFCNSASGAQPVTLTGTGAFTSGTFSAPAGLTINTTNGAITPASSNAGTFTVTYRIAPSGGCAGVTATTSVTIDAVIAPLFNPVGPICSGGTIPALPTTSLNGVTGTWSPSLNNTATTTYTFTPAGGQCASTATVTIGINAALPAPATTVTQPTCMSQTGTISVTPAIAGFTFSLDGGTFNVYPGIGYTVLPGAHTLRAQDGIGCISAVKNINVNAAPIPPGAVAISIVDATCGSNNGSITLGAVTGGTSPYSYAFNGGTFTSNSVYLNLSAGTYSIAIRDVNGCNFTTSATVKNSNGATVTAVVTNASCGASNGSITATGSGGVTPYQFSIDGTTFQASNVFLNLAANSYTVTIKDANNCTNSTTVVLNNSGGASVTATATNASCDASNGSITATGSGGVKPYQYSINGITFQASNVFSGIAANSYTVTVKDANNCTGKIIVVVKLSITVNVNAGADITICKGTLKQLNGISNTTNFSWSPQAGLSDPSILNPLASPSVTTKYMLTGTLGACSQSDTIIVFVNPAPVPNAGKEVSVCVGTSVQLSGSGGIIYNWAPAAYLSNTNISNPTLLSPPEGVLLYSLNVTDANGCSSLQADTVAVNILPQPGIFAGNDTSIVINQPLQLHAIDINNVGFVNYLWSPSAGLNNPSIQNPGAIISASIRYVLTATTAAGCKATDDIKITVFQKPDLYVPTAFTPNSDNLNDILKIITVGIKQLKYFKIFNRWGELVFNTTDAKKGWDGNYKGQGQNTYVFIWMAEGIDFNGNTLQKKGTVTLIR